MKKRFLTITSVLSVFLLIFTLNGCQEEGSEDFDTNIQTAQDYILCELSALDAFNIVFTSGIDSLLFADGSATIENATVSLDMTGDTAIIVDFGSIPIESFGKMRSGMITATLSSLNLLQPGANANVTFDNYVVEGIHVEAQSVLITNTTGVGNPMFNMTFNGGKLYSNGAADENDTLDFNSNKTIEMIAGSGSANFHDDDIFSIDGNANGNSSLGSNYNAEIIQALNLDFSCAWLMTQGLISCTTPEYVVPAQIDFGNGDCDETLTVTLEDNEGSIYTIPALLP